MQAIEGTRRTSSGISRKTGWVAAGSVLVVVALSVLFYFARAYWPYRYREVKPLLEDDFSSQVFIQSYHRTYFPHPGFVAMGVRLHRRNAPDAPDIGYAETMVVQGTWRNLLMLQRRVEKVEVAGLHVILPPKGSRAMAEDFPPGSSSDFTGPETSISHFLIHDAVLELQGEKGNLLRFRIPLLAMDDVAKNKPVSYVLQMRNPEPSGDVSATGKFGPLDAHNLAGTPLAGRFTFNSVRLADVGEVRGTLASEGTFHGQLGAVVASARAHVPDFAVAHGKATLVDGTIECTINGLNGDLAIQQIVVRTGSTTLIATGAIDGTPNATNLDLVMERGRAEDVLKPFINGEVPIEGPVRLRAHAYLAPLNQGAFLHRLHVTGTFEVPSEQITDKQTEKSLTDFSHRAQDPKQEAKQDGERAGRDVISSIGGPARIEDGVVSSQNITFAVPGAKADLHGTFQLESKAAHLAGNLTMQTDISHTTTGFKSLLLKPLSPFFKKRHGGTVVPIAIVGGPGHYQVKADLDRK